MVRVLWFERDGRAEIGDRVGVVVPQRVGLCSQAKGLRRLGVFSDVIAAKLDRGRQFSVGGHFLHFAERAFVGIGVVRFRMVRLRRHRRRNRRGPSNRSPIRDLLRHATRNHTKPSRRPEARILRMAEPLKGTENRREETRRVARGCDCGSWNRSGKEVGERLLQAPRFCVNVGLGTGSLVPATAPTQNGSGFPAFSSRARSSNLAATATSSIASPTDLKSVICSGRRPTRLPPNNDISQFMHQRPVGDARLERRDEIARFPTAGLDRVADNRVRPADSLNVDFGLSEVIRADDVEVRARLEHPPVEKRDFAGGGTDDNVLLGRGLRGRMDRNDLGPAEFAHFPRKSLASLGITGIHFRPLDATDGGDRFQLRPSLFSRAKEADGLRVGASHVLGGDAAGRAVRSCPR